MNICAILVKNFGMSKYGLVNLIDKIFITVGVFLLLFAWINFYLHSLWVSFVLSLIFCFGVVYLIFFLVGQKNKKAALTRQNDQEMNRLFLNFRLNPKSERLKLLKEILVRELCMQNKDYIKKDFENVVEKKAIALGENSVKNCEEVNKLNKNLTKNAKNSIKNGEKCENFVNLINGMLTFTINNKKHLVVLATQYEKIYEHDLINIVDEFLDLNFDEIDIVCAGVENVNANIFLDKKINFIDKFTLYQLFKKHNIYPKCDNIKTDHDKIRFVEILKHMFVPAKAKGYFLCGLVIIFSSIILPYHIYYLVFGSVLMLFSIACKLMPKFSN